MPGKKQFASAISKSGGAVTRRLVEGDELGWSASYLETTKGAVQSHVRYAAMITS
jgi:hypothetical protein